MCLFNEGFFSVSLMFEGMGMHCGPNLHDFVATKDENWISLAEQCAEIGIWEQRMLCRQKQISTLKAVIDAERLVYGSGFDESE